MNDPQLPLSQSTPGIIGGVTLATAMSHVHVLLGLIVFLFTLHSAYLRNRREKMLLEETKNALDRCQRCRQRVINQPDEP